MARGAEVFDAYKRHCDLIFLPLSAIVLSDTAKSGAERVPADGDGVSKRPGAAPPRPAVERKEQET